MLKNIKSAFAKSVSFCKKSALALAAAVGLGITAVTDSHAALVVPAIDLTDLYTAVGVLLTALTAIWIVYKVVGFFRGK